MTDTNDAVPVTEPGLLEPSFADAAKAIESAADLPARTRSHWLCSLRQIAKAMDKPMEIIPARWTAIRFAVGRLHHARVGANAKTLANHKSNVRVALLWFAAMRRTCRAAACCSRPTGNTCVTNCPTDEPARCCRR